MVRARGDNRTLELLDWEPPALAPRFDEKAVRAASLRSRISKAVAEALKDCGRSRDEVAAEMSAFLGEEVGKNMLDAYASEARDDHTISYLRLIALARVTGEVRLLQVGAEPLDHSVVADRYLGAIEDAMLEDKKKEIDQRQKHVRRVWKGGWQ